MSVILITFPAALTVCLEAVEKVGLLYELKCFMLMLSQLIYTILVNTSIWGLSPNFASNIKQI